MFLPFEYGERVFFIRIYGFRFFILVIIIRLHNGRLGFIDNGLYHGVVIVRLCISSCAPRLGLSP